MWSKALAVACALKLSVGCHDYQDGNRSRRDGVFQPEFKLHEYPRGIRLGHEHDGTAGERPFDAVTSLFSGAPQQRQLCMQAGYPGIWG